MNKIMKTVTLAIIMSFAFLLVSSVSASVANPTPKEVDLKLSMRRLWEDHITWTRMVIVGIVDNVPGTDLATTRLLKNYDDMEAAMTPFYGAKEAGVYGDLLKDHLVIAADFVKAAAAGDSVKAADLETQWYANAKAMSVQLNKMNPKNWPTEAVNSMMKDHLKYTKAEAVARISKDYSADIKAYDSIHEQALMMSDALSNGIIKQYPSKIKNLKAMATLKISTKASLPKFLVTADGVTLYTFAKDKTNVSNCSGQCAINWPPFSVINNVMPGDNIKGAFKKIERADGISQVTYKGMPLYTWIGDKVPGDTTGQGFGGVWSVAKP